MKTFNTAPTPTFIYFDLGGVLIEDFSSGNRLQGTLLDLGLKETDEARFRELWELYAAPSVCLDYETDNFQQIIKDAFGIKIPEKYSLLQHGFVDRFDPNPSINDVLNPLVGLVKLGLLTNMYPGMRNAIIAKPGLMPAIPWSVVIDSSEVGLQKPDKAIFEYATTLAGKSKEQILLIDNTVQNIDAAAAFGWQTYHYDSANYEQSSAELGGYLCKLGILK